MCSLPYYAYVGNSTRVIYLVCSGSISRCSFAVATPEAAILLGMRIARQFHAILFNTPIDMNTLGSE